MLRFAVPEVCIACRWLPPDFLLKVVFNNTFNMSTWAVHSQGYSWATIAGITAV